MKFSGKGRRAAWSQYCLAGLLVILTTSAFGMSGSVHAATAQKPAAAMSAPVASAASATASATTTAETAATTPEATAADSSLNAAASSPGKTDAAAIAATPASHVPGVGVGTLFQTLLGLVLVIGMILLCAWFTRRMGMQANSSTALIRIRASASLGQKQRLVMVEVGNQCLLLGVTPQNITTLESFPAADLPASSRASAPDIKQFSAALSSKIKEALNKRPPQ